MANIHALTVNGVFDGDEVFASSGIANDIQRGSSIYTSVLAMEVLGLSGSKTVPENVQSLYILARKEGPKDKEAQYWYHCYLDEEEARSNASLEGDIVREVTVNHLHQADAPWPRLLTMKRRGDPRISARVQYSADTHGTYSPGRIGLFVRGNKTTEAGIYWLQEAGAVEGLTRLVECSPGLDNASFAAVQAWAWSAVDSLCDMVKVTSPKRGTYYAISINGSWYVLVRQHDEEYNLDVVTPVLDPSVVSDVKRKYTVWKSTVGDMVRGQGLNIALCHGVLEWAFGNSPYQASFPRNCKVTWHTPGTGGLLPTEVERMVACGLLRYEYTHLNGADYFTLTLDYMKASYLGLFTTQEILDAGRYAKRLNADTSGDIREYLQQKAAEQRKRELLNDGDAADDEEDAGEGGGKSEIEPASSQ